MRAGEGRPAPRNLLEAKIRERNLTLDEFAEYAQDFARENGETGTLSTRQLQRLLAPATGPRPNPRPATRRLLEAIFEVPLADLLGPPVPDTARAAAEFPAWEAEAAELDRLVADAARVDPALITLLADYVDATRRLDRRIGAASLLPALRMHIDRVEALFVHCADGATSRRLATVLADAHALAGWQSLDRGEIGAAWDHYRHSRDAARAAESMALYAHAIAEQAVVLADIGRTSESVEACLSARAAARHEGGLLQSWLAAALGESLAADGQNDESIRCFDAARDLMHGGVSPADNTAYLTLDDVHLDRWRGNALVRAAHPDAAAVLARALGRHDAEFSRAEAALRTDLAIAYMAEGAVDLSRDEATTAARIAHAVGSVRVDRRLRPLAAT
jgi:tetratricopeptide (TPR) repeat protein